jgi:hypothetical protein
VKRLHISVPCRGRSSKSIDQQVHIAVGRRRGVRAEQDAVGWNFFTIRLTMRSCEPLRQLLFCVDRPGIASSVESGHRQSLFPSGRIAEALRAACQFSASWRPPRGADSQTTGSL